MKILTGICIILYVTRLEAQQVQEPLLRFGVIADIQYCDCEPANNRYYRNSLQKLDECVNNLNASDVRFTVSLGDLVDRDTQASLGDVLGILDKLENRCYHTTGNHDYGGITNNKSLYQHLEMPAGYYTFKYENWVFIMLNTNEISSYSNIEGTDREKELEAMTTALKANNRRNARPYNGGIGKKQMKWLEKQLKKAEGKGYNVMIFSHHPFYPDNGLSAYDDKEILELLSCYPCVKMAIAGHHHPGAFGEYNHIPFVTTEGVVETESENAYGIIELYSHKILIIGKGRTKSYEFPVKL